MSKPIDFTQGNMLRSIVLLSIPLITGELLQNLYNSADALVVGNFVDQYALAAVTVCGVIANMVVNFFNGMSVGANIVVAKASGSGDRARIRLAVRSAFSFGVVLGVVLSVLGILAVPQLLRFAGTQEDYFDAAQVYLRIYLAGLMFTVIYNNAAGILRALGRADVPFRILVVSCGMNIALDLLLTGVLRMGIAGVAQRLDRFVILAAKSFGITMTTCVGQNLGAGHYERIRKGERSCIAVALGVTLALSGIVYFFALQCVALFNAESEVVAVGVAMMHVLAPMFWIMALREILLGVLRGCGHSLGPTILSLTGMVGVRQVFLAFTMRKSAAVEYIYDCYPVACAATLLLLAVYYLIVRKRLLPNGEVGNR